MRTPLRSLRLFGVLGALLLSLAAFKPSGTHQTATPFCTADSQCAAAGQLCCMEFAYPGSPKICKAPMNGHCPLIP